MEPAAALLDQQQAVMLGVQLPVGHEAQRDGDTGSSATTASSSAPGKRSKRIIALKNPLEPPFRRAASWLHCWGKRPGRPDPGERQP
jgi:hypothetical protein